MINHAGFPAAPACTRGAFRRNAFLRRTSRGSEKPLPSHFFPFKTSELRNGRHHKNILRRKDKILNNPFKNIAFFCRVCEYFNYFSDNELPFMFFFFTIRRSHGRAAFLPPADVLYHTPHASVPPASHDRRAILRNIKVIARILCCHVLLRSRQISTSGG